ATRNIAALDTNYTVVATNAAGCQTEEEVLVYSFDPNQFVIQARFSEDNFCAYELWADVTAMGDELPEDVVSGVVFTNISQNQTYDGLLVQRGGNSWTYRLEDIEIPANMGSSDEWKVEALLNDVAYTIVDNCLLVDFFASLSPRTLYYGPFSFAMPNAFTPNGDGANDVFHPVGGIAETTELNAYAGRLQIFNRYGQKLFDSGTILGRFSQHFDLSDIAWNGHYNGQPSPSDVYVYLLNLENCDSPNTACTKLCRGQAINGITCEDNNDCLDYPYYDNNGLIQLGECIGCEFDGNVTLIR
ncbi:MAG: T9SS type B sorting domain-containing protein, partial [Bacteroidota bacterium]